MAKDTKEKAETDTNTAAAEAKKEEPIEFKAATESAK